MISRTAPIALLVLALATGCVQKAGDSSAAGERNEYIQSAERRLGEFDARLDTLRAQIQRADDSTRVALEKGVDQLQTARSDAQRKLDEARVAGEQAWQKAKLELADLLDALDRKLDEARTKLRS